MRYLMLIALVVCLVVVVSIVMMPTTPPTPPPPKTLSTNGFFPRSLLFSPDGKYLIAGTRKSPDREGELFVWKCDTWEQVAVIQHPQWVNALSISAKGDLLVAGIGCEEERLAADLPGLVHVYSFPDMKEKGKIVTGACVTSAAISPDGRLLASASRLSFKTVEPAEVKVWDAPTLNARYAIGDIGAPHCLVHFSPDSTRLAVSDFVKQRMLKKEFWRPILRQFKADSGEVLNVLTKDKAGTLFDSLWYTPDSKKLFSGLLCWDAATGQEIAIANPFAGRPFHETRGKRHNAHSSDGKILVIGIGSERGDPKWTPARIAVIDADTMQIKREFEFSPKSVRNTIIAIAISPDKKTIAVGEDRVYLLPSGE